MVKAIFPIVEGHGEVEAVPELLRRLARERFQHHYLNVMRPFRLPRGKILRERNLEKAVDFGVRKLSEYRSVGAIFVLLDADDDCPAELGPALLRRVRSMRSSLLSSVVIAKCEYESWFLASAISLRGKASVRPDAVPPPDPEAIRDAKGYLEREIFMLNSRYSETVDQVSLTALMNFDEARRCQSFEKLCRDLGKFLEFAPPDQSQSR